MPRRGTGAGDGQEHHRLRGTHSSDHSGLEDSAPYVQSGIDMSRMSRDEDTYNHVGKRMKAPSDALDMSEDPPLRYQLMADDDLGTCQINDNFEEYNGSSSTRWRLWTTIATAVISGVMIIFFAVYLVVHTAGPSPDSAAGVVPKGFVPLQSVMTTVVEEIRYAGHHNFVGRPIEGYEAPVCWVTEACAKALREVGDVAASMNPPMQVKVYDCYRPMRAVADFVAWGKNATADAMKDEFYPDLKKTDLFPRYISPRSSHARGSTVDITLVPSPPPKEPVFEPGKTKLVACTAPASQRWADNSIDMGTGFDCFSPNAWTNSTAVGSAQRANRKTLVDMMNVAGFTNLPEEWWHFTLRDEPFPDTYFDFPVVKPHTD